MQSSHDDVHDFEVPRNPNQLKRSSSNSSNVSNSVLDEYSSKADRKIQPGYTSNSIKVHQTNHNYPLVYSKFFGPVPNTPTINPEFELGFRKMERSAIHKNNSTTPGMLR
jgi:hypothetical protein